MAARETATGKGIVATSISKQLEIIKIIMHLSRIDSYLLSDCSSCQIVVKTDVLSDVGHVAAQDIVRLHGIHELHPELKIFQLAGIGMTTKGIKDPKIRGDMRSWLSNHLCTKYQMFGVKTLISRIIAECEGGLKIEHKLNGYYSTQAALYVSSRLSLCFILRSLYSAAFYVPF